MKLSSVLLIDKNVFPKPSKIAVVGTGTYNEQGKQQTQEETLMDTQLAVSLVGMTH